MLHDAHGFWIADAGNPPVLPPLEGEHTRRRRRRRRRLHRAVDGVAPARGRPGRAGRRARGRALRARAERAQRRLRLAHGPRRATRCGADYGAAGDAWVRAARETVDAIGAWCEAEGVDAQYRRGGELVVSTAPGAGRAQGARRSTATTVIAQTRASRPARAATRPCSAAACSCPHAANVHPARLAFGLRERLLARGARIFEGSRATGDPARRRGASRCGRPAARVRARDRRARRSTPPRGALRAAAQPAHGLLQPHRLHRAGARRARGARLARRRVDLRRPRAAALHAHDARRPDPVRLGRRADGGGRAAAAGGWRSTRASIAQVERDLVRFFPQLEGRAIAHAWGGPIDVSPTHRPAIVGVRGLLGLGRVRLHGQRRRPVAPVRPHARGARAATGATPSRGSRSWSRRAATRAARAAADRGRGA